jgi:hypothetical protein
MESQEQKESLIGFWFRNLRTTPASIHCLVTQLTQRLNLISYSLACEPNATNYPVLLLRCDVQIAFCNRQHIIHPHRLEESTRHEQPRDKDQKVVEFAEF